MSIIVFEDLRLVQNQLGMLHSNIVELIENNNVKCIE